MYSLQSREEGGGGVVLERKYKYEYEHYGASRRTEQLLICDIPLYLGIE